jgi:hypothetical protein
LTLGGLSFPESRQLTSDGAIVHDVLPAVGQAGTLSTRSDDDTGVITMTDSGHTITTGARVDLYWTVGGVAGMCRDVTVGTVSGSSVPIEVASGDALPAQTSAITVCIPEELDIVVDGDQIAAIALYSVSVGQVSFVEDSDVEAASFPLGAGEVYLWHNVEGADNPLAGKDIVKVYLSHRGTTAATQIMRVGILYANA